ncbi:vanadium-dependent haloperoxidase [Variovorax robiniae]|uniref:Vanadium-dependent haloperoxidase n=1 Tax=Variovorax robiniae TaxID=1836199 RepID=A0ABU8XDT0_9BURK
MNRRLWMLAAAGGLGFLVSLMAACGGGGGGGLSGLGVAAPMDAKAVQVTVGKPNAVTYWNAVGTDVVAAPADASGSPAEMRPSDSVDLAVMHLAIYNALVSIAGQYQPFGVVLADATGSGASQQAAVGAAAYGVLKGMYPHRTAQYQGAYDSFVASIPDDSSKSLGLAIGKDSAQAILALRGDDGRSVELAPYVPGTAPGQFRGMNPVNRFAPFIKPFTLAAASQFRAPAPPALDSELYARDLNETRAMGGAVSSTRTDAQLEIAKFYTEAPPRYWNRNLRRFAMSDASLLEQARLMAMFLVVEADTGIACFDSKYYYQSWRPQSAIPLADTDGNSSTTADPAWKPVVPTPNHPEYPAAHGCVTAAVAETIKTYYGTDQVAFTLDSTVTGTTHSFKTTEAMAAEVIDGRVFGGMHFRNSVERGEDIGRQVAQWVLKRNFLAREKP